MMGFVHANKTETGQCGNVRYAMLMPKHVDKILLLSFAVP